MASNSRKSGIGAFLQSLGQSGMNIAQYIDQSKADKEKAAINKKFSDKQLEQMNQALEKGKLDIKAKGFDIDRKKQVEGKIKTLQKILSDDTVKQELIKRTVSQKNLASLEGLPGMDMPETTEANVITDRRPPSTEEQLQRIRGTEFETSPEPEIRTMVGDVRKRYQEEQAPVLEQQKFDREQEGKIELQELRGSQSMERETFKSNVKEKDRKRIEASPIFKTLSEKEKTYVYDANSTFQNLDNVMSIVDKLDEGKLKGFIRAVQGKKEVLKNPEVQELYSAYQMLTGAITKQIQGARPSDYDAVKYEMATGQRAISKENMKAALNMIGKYVSAQTNSVKNTIVTGYNEDEERVSALFSDVANKYLSGDIEDTTGTDTTDDDILDSFFK